MIEQGEILTLSDNKTYSVAYSTELDSKKYVCLIDQNDYTNIMFCEYIDGELTEVTDPEISEELLKTFTNYNE